ncbi:hypothetical protein [Rossellomorea aquimaris]|uniref:hypothetical protein n=1 Tax=Rossellomorea aquimaris TaxID=189382 RepID=UPI001CFD9213|nr:hypothetical protein [Rossellomorea aquimaris]
MDSNQFFQLLKQIRKKLLINECWISLQLLLVYAGAFALFVITLASIIAIPYWDRILWSGITLIFIAGGMVTFNRRPTLKDSALFYDRFIEDNRVTAAYSSLQSGHPLSPLVTRDALERMRRALPEIKGYRRKIMRPKWLMTTLSLVLLSLLIYTQRDATFQQANQMEREREIIAQSDKRITEQAKKKGNAAIKERLLKENEELKDKKKATERYKEINKVVKELELKKKKVEKQNAKLLEVKHELDRLNLPTIKKAIEDADGKLMKSLNKLSEQQKDELMNALKDQGIDSPEELADLLNETRRSEGVSQLAKLQEEMQKEAELLQKAIGESGTTTDPGTVAQKPSSHQKGSSSSSQPNTASTTNQKPSSANGGQGSGTQNSTGRSGNGSGAGGGNGSGKGAAGNGNGAGSGQGSREMLSVPEKISGKNSVELDSGELGKGERGDQFETDGPVQKGSLRPYEEVYQEYYSLYRNGASRATIPKDLEHIIESYFSEIDPGE